MGEARADFTSALYLGMRHPMHALHAWDSLTLGKPAALSELPAAGELASGLASLMACEAAVLLPSTLHLFWDLFGMLKPASHAVLVDGGAYPVGRWGAARAGANGVPVQVFPAMSAGMARGLAAIWARRGVRPVILADGYTPGSAQAPPLADYADVAWRYGGWLVLDDTQVLGLRGPQGGGSVAALGLEGAPILVGASLAKAFGVPLAVLAASRRAIEEFTDHSETRMHASPPSAAAIAAGFRALRLNSVFGDRLRAALARRVAGLRAELADARLACHGGDFPVQMLTLPASVNGRALQHALARGGVDVLLQRDGAASRLAMVLRADHGSADIARAAAALRPFSREIACTLNLNCFPSAKRRRNSLAVPAQSISCL